MINIQSIISLPVKKAVCIVVNNKLSYKVIKNNSMFTCEFKKNRVILLVDKLDTVTDCYFG